MKIQKGDTIKNLKIEKIGFGGVGISTLENNKKIIVKGADMPGAIVNIKVEKDKKDYIEGELIKIVENSNLIRNDIDNLCKHHFYFEKKEKQKDNSVGCGGCKWQIFDYNTQLELKLNLLKDSFRKIIDKLEKVGIQDILTPPLQKGYRNKIEFSFGKNKIGNSQCNLGMHKFGDFSSIVDLQNCYLVSEKSNDIFKYIKELTKKSGLDVYDTFSGEGFLNHLIIRQGFNTDQFLVNISVADKNLQKNHEKQKWYELKEKIKNDSFLNENITTFLVTYDNILSNDIDYKNSQVEILFGKGYISEKLNISNGVNSSSLEFKISPFSFFQTNTYGAEKMFSKASEIIENKGGTLLDLYCGAGSIGLSFLKLGNFDNLIGIESVNEAINDAKYNAKINNLQNYSYFKAGKAESLVFEDKYIKTYLENISTVVVDPPREGLHKNVIKFLVYLKKYTDYQLIYISCNPVTMSRDFQSLFENGFTLKYFQPVDLFPDTYHIENISLFG